MGGGNGKPSLLFSPSHKSFLSMDTFDRIPIVPLDQAIEPLLLLIPSIQTYVDLVKGKCRVPADGLTSDQSAAIMLYCIVWRPREQCLYTRFNAVLQSRSPQQLKPWLFYVKLLFSALLQLPSIDLTVYRGSQSNLQQQYSLDQTITWLELSLSTGSLEYLESDACLGKKGVRTICTIRGSTVKDIHQHTYDASNRLALFLPGRRFKVIESFNQTEDLHCLTLKEIESDLLAARFWPSQKKNIAHSSVPLHDHQRTATLEHRILEHTQSWIIDLDKQDLTDHDMSIVVKQALMKTHCRRIRLRDNHITFQGSSILAQGLLHNTTLESLDLRHNLISDLGIKSLAMSIAQSNIKTLNLESNEITAEGALHLFQMLRDSRSLTELYLSKNHLGDRGVEFLAKALTDPNAKNSQRQGQRTVCLPRSIDLFASTILAFSSSFGWAPFSISIWVRTRSPMMASSILLAC